MWLLTPLVTGSILSESTASNRRQHAVMCQIERGQSSGEDAQWGQEWLWRNMSLWSGRSRRSVRGHAEGKEIGMHFPRVLWIEGCVWDAVEHVVSRTRARFIQPFWNEAEAIKIESAMHTLSFLLCFYSCGLKVCEWRLEEKSKLFETVFWKQKRLLVMHALDRFPNRKAWNKMNRQ